VLSAAKRGTREGGGTAGKGSEATSQDLPVEKRNKSFTKGSGEEGERYQKVLVGGKRTDQKGKGVLLEKNLPFGIVSPDTGASNPHVPTKAREIQEVLEKKKGGQTGEDPAPSVNPRYLGGGKKRRFTTL